MKNYKFWIALEQSKGIGPANLRTIYDALNSNNLSITDIFDLTASEIKEEFSFNDKIIDAIVNAKESLPMIEDEYFYLLEAGVDTIIFFEDPYPTRFMSVLGSAFPPILYTYGDKNILKEKGAAILGEKDVSDKGKEITYLAAGEFVKSNIVTISGFASGVDEIAHRSALLNSGKTIAILPYGIKSLKIPEILKDIQNLDNLLIMSPFYPTIEYNKYNAYVRNRLICALSYAVYIVESPLDSGIFEAGKSAGKFNLPLFVTEYSKYPDSASANRKLIDELHANPVKGKMIDNVLTPNLDKLIEIVQSA